MGNTTGGLPWPEPTMPVRDGAAAIRALAEATDKIHYPPHLSFYVFDKNVTTDGNGLFLVAWAPPIVGIVGGIITERTVGDANTPPTILRFVQMNNGGGQAIVKAWNPSTLAARANYGLDYSAIFWGTD
jgi:hypothetical protein